MTDKTDKTNWTGKAAMAGAAIGSAALAAALLYASRRRDNTKAASKPVTPENAPETD
jgi:Inorganic pyrophosphatase